MKPRVFIGSSSEQLDTAYAIQQNLEHDCECTVWNQGIFKLSSNILDDLLSILMGMDFGIFVFAPEDITYIRGREHQTTRDNIIFEFGLFIGRLGKERTYFVLPKDIRSDFRLPSDLIGVTPATYDAHRSERRAALGPACNEIRGLIRRLGPRHESRLDMIQAQKDVYTYVFNRLNPYRDISLSQDFLRSLPTVKRFFTIDDVLYPLDSLIHHYVPRFIEPWMRVYFAYKLSEPVRVSSSLYPKVKKNPWAYYRFGISYSKHDERWYEGFPVGIPSNVHRVYDRNRISKVRDARQQIHHNRAQNEEVENEGSVIGFPVQYSDDDEKCEVVGVIGISSPKVEEVTTPDYEALAEELSILFSALFYAYGRFLQRSKTFDEVINQLRYEIAEHYDSKFTVTRVIGKKTAKKTTNKETTNSVN